MAAERAQRGIVVGLGVMGSHHLRVLSALEGAEVAAVVDPSQERRAGALALNPGVAGFATLAEALAAGEATFACLAAPVGELPELAIEAMGAGLAVMVEKPMAPSEDAALRMIAEAEQRGLLLAVGLVERCNPAVRELKSRLDAGQAGRIFQIHARRLSPFPNRDSMLGVSVDLATHDVDVMRFLTGGEVERVYSETARRRHETAEDLLCATLRLDGDVTGLLEVNWLTPTKVRQLSVTGESGMFVVDYLTQDLYFHSQPSAEIGWGALAEIRGGGEGDMTRYALERREPLVVEWESFLSALGGDGAPAASGRDGLAALSTALAIQASGSSHEPVAPAYRKAPVG